MADYAVVVADTVEALKAVASVQGLALVPGTTKAFDTLTTYRSPAIVTGDIDVGTAGFVALATVK